MKAITIRDLRQRWPEAEKALQVENEILITRDSKPVAKLVRITPETESRPRWDPEEHRRWQERVNKGRLSRWVDKSLAESRVDRWPLASKARKAKHR